MKRRSVMAMAGTGLTCGLAGCLDFVLGSDPLEIGAGEVRVPDEVLEETGYEFVGANEFVVEEEVEAMGQTREVIATNVQAEYERTIDAGPLGSVEGAIFSGVTTPSVSVLGREFNPLGGMDTDTLVELVQNRYERVQNVEHEEDRAVTINEQDVPVGVYTADATFAGQEVEVYLHVTEAVDFDEDLAVAVGAYPAVVPSESDRIDRMMESLTPRE